MGESGRSVRIRMRRGVVKKKMILLWAAVACFACAACTPPSQPASGEPEPEPFVLSALRAEGDEVLNAEGERVMLRGVNAGGLGVIETWMTGFRADDAAPGDGSPGSGIRVRDHYTASQVLIERFGFGEAAALWQSYRESWWSDDDFQNCGDLGINVIRLPFTYMDVDFDAVRGDEYAGIHYDFSFLEDFVDRAEEYGIYTILDLHGAYGSQNGQDHSGQVIDAADDVHFYENETDIALTEKLWAAVAEHFRDDPAVAGYDLLNEPAEKNGTTEQKHWIVFDRLYDAIRAKDEKHIVIFESCWDENGLPMPAEYGWENCMYSFHHYTSYCVPKPTTAAAHLAFMTERVEGILAADFGVPIQMGEFTCYNFKEYWEGTLGLFNKNNVHWTTWTYKVMPESGASPWGIYNILDVPRVNVHTDSPEEMRQKFLNMDTVNAVHYTFADGSQLFDLIHDYAKEEVPAPAPDPEEAL